MGRTALNHVDEVKMGDTLPSSDTERERMYIALRELLGSNSGWLDIATAPKDGRAVLLWDGASVSVGYWTNSHTKPWHGLVAGEDANWSDDGGPKPILDATHWMPLPAPPVE